MADIVCGECGCANEATIGYEQDQIKHGELGPVTAIFPVWTCNACGFKWLDQKSFAARDGAIEAAKRAQPPTDQPPTDQPAAGVEPIPVSAMHRAASAVMDEYIHSVPCAAQETKENG